MQPHVVRKVLFRRRKTLVLVSDGYSQRKEENMNTKIRFASVAMLSVMAVIGTTSHVWADKQGLELRARQNKQINGFEAELRGDYREQSNRDRLNAELEKVNIPVGTPVAFCLLHAGAKSAIGVADVAKAGGVLQAQIELEGEEGAPVPKVVAGDVLQAHQSATAPFSTSPTCADTLLISAPFLK
jgi:hypothetical protein